MAKHDRRTYLVDRSFQLKYILLLMAWGAVLAGLFGLWTYQAHRQAVEPALALRDPALGALLSAAGRRLLWAVAGIGALTVAAMGLLGFIMTHRVAGPVHVMGHLLAELAQGRYPARRALRRRDELQALHARFAEAVEALRQRDLGHLARLDDAIALLRAGASHAPDLGGALGALEREVRDRRLALTEGAAASPAAAQG